MPAGSSRFAVAASQPLSPKERRTAGSAMPKPSSVTVTTVPPSGTSSVATSSRVAPLRREFWISSAAASATEALKNLETRSMAPSWTRGPDRGGQS